MENQNSYAERIAINAYRHLKWLFSLGKHEFKRHTVYKSLYKRRLKRAKRIRSTKSKSRKRKVFICDIPNK